MLIIISVLITIIVLAFECCEITFLLFLTWSCTIVFYMLYLYMGLYHIANIILFIYSGGVLSLFFTSIQLGSITNYSLISGLQTFHWNNWVFYVCSHSVFAVLYTHFSSKLPRYNLDSFTELSYTTIKVQEFENLNMLSLCATTGLDNGSIMIMLSFLLFFTLLCTILMLKGSYKR